MFAFKNYEREALDITINHNQTVFGEQEGSGEIPVGLVLKIVVIPVSHGGREYLSRSSVSRWLRCGIPPPLVFRSRSSNFFVFSTSAFTAMRLSYIRFIISWTTRDFRVPGHRSPSQLAARGSRLVRLRRVKSRWKNSTVLFVAHKVSTRTASSSPGLTPHAPSLGS